MFVKVFVILSLVAIAIEDIRYRSVHVYLFAFLLAGVWYIAFDNNSSSLVYERIITNVLFCILLFGLLNLYYCLKEQRWHWIFDRYLGWGDVVFLLSITAIWDIYTFIFYVILSLVLSLLIYLLLISNRSKYIPLAGLQAVVLALVLCLEWTTLLNFDHYVEMLFTQKVS